MKRRNDAPGSGVEISIYEGLYPLMAAIASVNDLTLVTHNTDHFSRLTDLRLEDWLVS